MNKLLPYQNENILELGIDEAGRGCLFGRLYVAGVILPSNILELCEENNIVIKDSKKMNKKNKDRAKEFIENVAIDYSVVYKESWEIDQSNILACTLEAMHDVVDKIKIKPDKILVDGDKFKKYLAMLKDQNDPQYHRVLSLWGAANDSLEMALLGDDELKNCVMMVNWRNL